MTTAILPCAGFGIRMGMLPHESKEMLPETDGSRETRHIIDFSLNISNHYKLKPKVIIRPEKTGLIEYLKHHWDVSMSYTDGSGEWPASVLASKDQWEENNILILPDTRFYLNTVIPDIIYQLENGCSAVLGLHTVNDPEKWGIVKEYSIYEKPTGLTGPQKAWGVIGFKASYGRELFENMKLPNGLPLHNTAFVQLTGFKDITRSKND